MSFIPFIFGKKGAEIVNNNTSWTIYVFVFFQMTRKKYALNFITLYSGTLLTPSKYRKCLFSPSALLKREHRLSLILLHRQFMFLFF